MEGDRGPAGGIMARACGNHRAAAIVLAVLALMIGPAAYRPGEPVPPPDPFEAVDLDFRAFYGRGRAATLDRLDPVIVVEMDKLVLKRGGKRAEATVIPPLYHRLKAVSHIPLALYVALAPHRDEPLDGEKLDQLRTFRARVEAVAVALEGSGFSPEQAARSRAIVQRSAAFLDGVLSSGRYDPAALVALTRSLGPLVLAHAADAAKAQIDAYHARVSAWRAEIPPSEWARLRVVVMGVQMPRRHNTAVQYFAKLLGLPGESRRLVYAEELPGADEPGAENLLATHQLDSELSSAFFADPERMEIDLLGNAAATYLDTLDLDR